MPPCSTLYEIRDAIDRRELNLSSLVRSYLQRINGRKSLYVFVEVFDDEALDHPCEPCRGSGHISSIGQSIKRNAFWYAAEKRSFKENELLNFSKYMLDNFNTLA